MSMNINNTDKRNVVYHLQDVVLPCPEPCDLLVDSHFLRTLCSVPGLEFFDAASVDGGPGGLEILASAL